MTDEARGTVRRLRNTRASASHRRERRRRRRHQLIGSGGSWSLLLFLRNVPAPPPLGIWLAGGRICSSSDDRARYFQERLVFG